MKESSPVYPSAPVVGVGVVIIKDDAILLIRRKNAPHAGRWSIPGGRQQLGETVIEAACREVYEETSMRIAPPELLKIVDSIQRDDEGRVQYHYTLIDWLADGATGEPLAGDDAEDVHWFSFEELASLGLWEETLAVIDLARARLRAREESHERSNL